MNEDKQLDVCRAVVDMVKSRLDKAKTGNTGKTKNGIDILKAIEENDAEIEKEEV